VRDEYELGTLGEFWISVCALDTEHSDLIPFTARERPMTTHDDTMTRHDGEEEARLVTRTMART
jgi:hypothetical protein